MSRFRKLLAMGLLALTGIPVKALRAQTRVQVASVSPNQAESGKPFQVTVSGKTTLCNPQFSKHSVRTGEGALYLTVLAENDPLSKCTAGEHDFAVVFQVPALKADTFEVDLYLPPACAFSSSPCPIANAPFYAGKLWIRDSASLYFAFRPKQVEKEKAFELFVFNEDFTCGNEYTDLTTNVSGHSLTVSFTNRSHPEAVCPAVVSEHGPTFQVPAMKSGVYQVFATATPYCLTQGLCTIAMVAPQLAGALTVGEGTVSFLPSTRPAAKEKSGPGTGGLSIDPRIGVRGWWHAAAFSLSGRRQ